jgi:hypothetical protein
MMASVGEGIGSKNCMDDGQAGVGMGIGTIEQFSVGMSFPHRKWQFRIVFNEQDRNDGTSTSLRVKCRLSLDFAIAQQPYAAVARVRLELIGRQSRRPRY